jgi:adenylosuccinate synthase
MKAIAVIGMNFGDEGKGHMTNYFSGPDCLNIKFNGGAQAAHAVSLSDGRGHIFHHFGSGSMVGARTLLASKFIVNPILFSQEFSELASKMTMREIFIDPRCRVTTHYDMLINSFQSNFNKANNTTGVGINETIERSQFRQLKISMRDLMDKDVKGILETIQNEYVPYRVRQLKLSYKEYLKYYKKRVTDTNRTVEQFLNVIKFMLKHVVMWPDDNLIERFVAKDQSNRYVVFEGGQGMRLDQSKIELMPFLTRSSTGIRNVLYIMRTIKEDINLEVCLVTRSYLTRHGEGPLENEFELPYENIEELSNPYNSFQGKMRYGLFNHDWYHEAIHETNNSIANKLTRNMKRIKVSTAITCLDHVDIELRDLNPEYISNGPTEKDITAK